MEYTNSQIRELIAEHIHSERDRNILLRRLIDGITFERLAEEFDMSTRQMKTIVHKNETILFKPLGKNEIAGILDLIVEDLNKRLEDRNYKVMLTKEAKDKVIAEGYNPNYGARPLKRYVQKTVETLAAKLILSGTVSEGDTITIDVDENGFTAR